MENDEIKIGTLAETVDGKDLGPVGAVKGDYVRIDPEQGSQYWLPAWTVGVMTTPIGMHELPEASLDRVQVQFRHDELENNMVALPPDFDETKDGRDPLVPLLPPEEEQRKAMLAEVVEQREEREEEGTGMPDADRTVGEPVEQELDRLVDEDEQRPGAPPTA